MSCATLPTFVPGRELELVAGDARARDLADDRRLDAEVREALQQRLGDARGSPRRSGRCRASSGCRSAAVRQPVLGRGACVGLEERCLRVVGRVVVGRLNEQRTSERAAWRRGRGSRGRRRRAARAGQRLERRRIVGSCSGTGSAAAGARSRRTRRRRAAHGVPGAADDRAERGAGEEEHADERQQDAEDRRAGRADPERDETSRAARRPSRRARRRARASARRR